MPKEWGDTKPNISKHEKVVPENHTVLLASLQELGKNWSYVRYCGVITVLKGIFVDLGTMANTAGYKDFYNPLKALDVEKADVLVKAIVAKVEAGKPIVEQDAKDLFATMETA
jgi:hypothetical protein